MKKVKVIGWLALALVLVFLIESVCAANFEGVEINLKDIERQIKTQNSRDIFVNWSDDQIVDFIELVSLMQKDMEVTQITIDKYGFYAEVNTINRQLYATVIESESALLPSALAYYLVINELPEKQRTIVIFLFRILEVYFIDTHRFYYGHTLSDSRVPVMTIVRLKF